MLPKICKTLIIGPLLLFLIGPTPARAQEKGPIKIGFITTASGPFAQMGKDMIDGASLYLEENKNTMAGRKIDLIIEDEAGEPAVALTKARKLVEMNGVHLLVGPLMGSSGYALQPYVDSKRMPTVYAVPASDDITQRKRAKWIIRVGWNHSQPSHPFGEYAGKVLDYRKISFIGMDYSFGWEVLGGFQRTFEESGGKIVQKIWCPLTTQDFSPYIAQIRRDSDAVFAALAGKLSMVFLKQYQEYGLKEKIPILGGGTLTDESILPSLGDEAIGVISALHYSAAIDTPINKEFVKKYREKYGRTPSYYSETCYTAMRWVHQAVDSLGGDVNNPEKVFKALRSIQLEETPRGPLRVDSYGEPVQNIYIRKVERVGGELQNTVIHTYPHVSQFWKYKPGEFLTLPPYSRDYPPIKP